MALLIKKHSWCQPNSLLNKLPSSTLINLHERHIKMRPKEQKRRSLLFGLRGHGFKSHRIQNFSFFLIQGAEPYSGASRVSLLLRPGPGTVHIVFNSHCFQPMNSITMGRTAPTPPCPTSNRLAGYGIAPFCHFYGRIPLKRRLHNDFMCFPFVILWQPLPRPMLLPYLRKCVCVDACSSYCQTPHTLQTLRSKPWLYRIHSTAHTENPRPWTPT